MRPDPAGLVPGDAADGALLAQVHPPGWTNPEPKPRYHLVVIGAGTGGLVSAAGAAALGARVALVERHLMGGDCLNVGCVPSKAVIGAARGWHAARRAAADLHGPAATGDGDFTAVMARMRRLRAGLAPVDGAPRFQALGVDVFLGDARFTGPDTAEVDGRVLRFRRAIIATGARAALPEIPGLADAAPRTNETIFALTERPASLVVLGAGPIGCELAQAFARLGCRVALVDRAPRILPRDDADAAAIVQRALAADGVALHLGVTPLRVEREGARRVLVVRAADAELRLAGDELLVAAGRRPNVEGLGLEAAGVAHDARGVRVDDRLRTANPRIYAVGDVCSALQFTHAADAQARLALRNALFLGRARASRLVVPWCTYTAPEVAHVGLTREAAAAEGVALDEVTVDLRDVDRAVLDGETEGFLRVLLRRGTDRIVGATLVAAHAGDLIGEAALAITAGLGLGAIGATIHPYPTQGEVFRKAADQWNRRRLTPSAQAWLARWFRLW
ncbi:MAG: mercuric reductase [Gemmatimonadales bacterium]|nr:mercuric reductase [Gemmatimonadales bacterium]